jgi:hypothetical protein
MCGISPNQGGTLWADSQLSATALPWLPLVGLNAATTPIVFATPATYVVPQIGVSSFSACNYAMPSNGHPGVIQVGMGDASVRVVNQGVLPLTFTTAMVPNENLPLGGDW